MLQAVYIEHAGGCGHGPVQPALGEPALAGGVGLDDPRGLFQPLTFRDSVLIL